MNVLMCGETIPRGTLYRGLNKWSIELTRLSQRSVAVSHSIIHIAVSYGNSTVGFHAVPRCDDDLPLSLFHDIMILS